MRGDMSKPTPATPVTPTFNSLLVVADDDQEDEDGMQGADMDDEDEQARVGIRTGTTLEDPYASLDSAFGGGSVAKADSRSGPENDSLI
jgi:hypothetical protein